MIYTVTFNPALDYNARLFRPTLGALNRVDAGSESVSAGGKGLNVSAVLRVLGFESTALGFIAGFTGYEILKRAERSGCKCDFITVEEGFSRINVKIKSGDGGETEINGQGPAVLQSHIEALKLKLNRLCKGDALVLAGSVPPSVGAEVYGDMMSRLVSKGVLVIVDTAGALLMNTLKYHPFLITPNEDELGELFHGAKIDGNKNVALRYALLLKELGAKSVLVTMGKNGAVLLTERGDILKQNAPKGKAVNTVGAGDAAVAGFIAGWLETGDYEHALKLSVAAGSAAAFSEGIPAAAEIYGLMKTIDN